MNTTDNEYADTTAKKNVEITKEDAKKMKTEYIAGETIDNLADSYGYEPAQVAAVVVDETLEDAPLPTQEDTETENKKTK